MAKVKPFALMPSRSVFSGEHGDLIAPSTSLIFTTPLAIFRVPFTSNTSSGGYYRNNTILLSAVRTQYR